MSALTYGKLIKKCLFYIIYIYIYIFFFFEKQVKRIMCETDNNDRVFKDGKRYRVWSLTGQGYLKLTTTGDKPSVECSGTGNELSSNTEILNNCFSLSVQFPLIGVAIRSFCWLLIRYLKPFLFVF